MESPLAFLSCAGCDRYRNVFSILQLLQLLQNTILWKFNQEEVWDCADARTGKECKFFIPASLLGFVLLHPAAACSCGLRRSGSLERGTAGPGAVRNGQRELLPPFCARESPGSFHRAVCKLQCAYTQSLGMAKLHQLYQGNQQGIMTLQNGRKVQWKGCPFWGHCSKPLPCQFCIASSSFSRHLWLFHWAVSTNSPAF